MHHAHLAAHAGDDAESYDEKDQPAQILALAYPRKPTNGG
jgi:hypothetical protein